MWMFGMDSFSYAPVYNKEDLQQTVAVKLEGTIV